MEDIYPKRDIFIPNFLLVPPVCLMRTMAVSLYLFF